MTWFAQPTSKPWRVAMVGAGFFSQFHLDGWSRIPNVTVGALCDLNLARAQVLANKFGVEAVVDSVDALLAQGKPDLIDLVTPSGAQEQLLEQLIPLGIPIVCQKPFGSDVRQAQCFAAAAAQHGTPLIVHENFRFMPWHRELKRLIDVGYFGDLHGISFRLRPGDGQGPNAYMDRQPYFQTMPRLLMAETGVHYVDTFRYLMGEVSSVYAQLRRVNPVIQGEDAGVVVFGFDNRSVGLFDGNRLNDHSANNPRRTFGEMWLEGSAGVMRLDGFGALHWKPHHGPEVEHVYDAAPQDHSFGAGACGALQRHVLDGLSGECALENTAHDYLQNLRVQEAIYESNSQGCKVDLHSFQFS
ncbi:Gfo/Idh/MocA family oxidoreductase [Rhodoferax sp.]|uniref:Gfo/Idh/MocA family protein n=1 Tax=Rhodoferax sp. TaxID=50421 RepID=UPI0025F460F3|nr:Gfo/Idh/MocA family oxidoreductase [Rhodoferax sp.]